MRQRVSEETWHFGLEIKGNTVHVYWVVLGDDIPVYDSDKEDLIVFTGENVRNGSVDDAAMDEVSVKLDVWEVEHQLGLDIPADVGET